MLKKTLTFALILASSCPQLAIGQDLGAENPTFDEAQYRRIQWSMPVLLETGESEVESWDGSVPPPTFQLTAGAVDPVAVHTKTASLTKAVPNRRYNEVQQKSSHNSFQKQEALIDQLVYHRIRSLELDLHTSKGSSWPIRSQDWYVYHVDSLDADTTCHRFSDCLDELRSFHDANPDHEVVTVFLDIKDPWQTSVNPTDLDTRIRSHLPNSMVFRPADWLWTHCSGETTLQGAAKNCKWPWLRDLRGKFIFVLTGNSPELEDYVSDGVTAGAAALARTAFVAHQIDDADAINANNYGVFFNIKGYGVTNGATGNMKLALNVDSSGYVSRAYYLNTYANFYVARSYGAHHLATDKINFEQDTWSKTHNDAGWPFQCFDACSTTLEEGHRTIGVEVDSEDIWGSSDHFRFHYEITSGTNFWTAAINTKNSHTEDWAKGCLMARQSFSSDSPYFAVCRPNDDHRLRIQWRSSTGGSTNRTDGNIVPDDTVDEESISRVALYVYNNDTCAAGYGSLDGNSWKLIGYKCFGGPLSRQGLASSSHGGGKVKFLYSSVRKNGMLYSKNTFPYSYNFGTVRSAQVFDGVFP